MISAEDYREFVATVHAPGQTELQCAAYLHHAAALLTDGTPFEIHDVRLEDRSFFGRTDFIVVATMLGEAGGNEKKAFIWELKAPQLPLFEGDGNQNRYRPTPALLHAENQLLHYYHEALGSDGFRNRFDIMNRDNIKIGGIVIGNYPSVYASGATSEFAMRLATHSLNLRKRFFYSSVGMRVYTWDRILENVDPTLNKVNCEEA
ncbi:hypothetical protein [Methylorubrum aminovorans]